jgi:hypothetical protein
MTAIFTSESAMKRACIVLSIAVLASALLACKPEVGSEAWCKAMRDKPRGDWTVNEVADFAQSCILK